MKTKRLLGYYDYTVVLTYIGMLSSFISILLSINENYHDAILFLMLAGVCDMFDGTVANTKDRTPSEKKFGIQIDSLSDLISFGVMPALFVYIITGKSVAGGVIGAIFALAALIRLAYFNVTEEERQQQTNEKRTVYQGLPVTSIAILLPLVFWLNGSGKIHSMISYMVLLVVCGAGFLSPFEIKKPSLVGKVCLIMVGVLEFLVVLFLGRNLV
ncbi:MAG: CDP-alcohol phosphatidyltransferase family protein [Butyrivibrio sp.]|nr:CDP-alcohol phosphatidyltransferase family protein [Butyrivibrio sp.]